MIAIRGRPADAWRSARCMSRRGAAPIRASCPTSFLARLSVPRQAAHYDAAIRSSTARVRRGGVGHRRAGGQRPRIVGFATAGRARGGDVRHRLGEGEVETLYVLDDWRERGMGRRLMRAAAAHLAEAGCRSCFVWVLRDNPSRWFYQRLGGKPAAEAAIKFAGQPVVQTAFVWDPIERLLAASPQDS